MTSECVQTMTRPPAGFAVSRAIVRGDAREERLDRLARERFSEVDPAEADVGDEARTEALDRLPGPQLRTRPDDIRAFDSQGPREQLGLPDPDARERPVLDREVVLPVPDEHEPRPVTEA